MKDPIEWLCAKDPGFSLMPEDERLAIMHFSLLWSLFEAEAFAKQASEKDMPKMAAKWARFEGFYDPAFEESLAYFRQRCSTCPTPADYCANLGLRKNERRDLVIAVLSREKQSPVDCLATLLIIVFRIRNNFFHGEKWAYGLLGQLDNFRHANNVIITALELYSAYKWQSLAAEEMPAQHGGSNMDADVPQ